MKPTQITELLANIRKTFVSFFSILMFVALGVAVFVGIKWTATALENAVDQMVEEGKLHHVQIMFPYGLTQDDIDELAKVEGVTSVEPTRQAFALYGHDGSDFVFKLQTVGSSINVLSVKEGVLPAKAGEIALKQTSAEELGLKVGDTISLESLETGLGMLSKIEDSGGDNADDVDADGISEDGGDGLAADDAADDITESVPELATDTFTITALVESPEYISRQVLTYGVSNAPNGAVDVLSWVTPDTFNDEAFLNAYNVVNVRCGSLQPENMFSDKYAQQSGEIERRISALGNKLGTARSEKLRGGLQERVDDGEKLLDDAEQKIEEGERAVEDGERQLQEGRSVYMQVKTEAEQQLEVAYEQLQKFEALKSDAEKMLDEAQRLMRTARSAVNAVDEARRDVSSLRRETKDFQREEDELLEEGVITEKEYKADCKAYTKQALVRLKPYAKLAGINISKLDYTEFKFLLVVCDEVLKALQNTTITINGEKMSLAKARKKVVQLSRRVNEAESKYRNAVSGLDDAWDTYYAAQAALDERSAEFNQEMEENSAKIESVKQQIEDGKEIIKEKEGTLDAAKQGLAGLKDYSWTVSGRSANGGVVQAETFASVTDRLSFSMAALFVIVGLLVSYSAVGRIVNEQIAQIGTKKALGLRRREITISFLAYSGLAVIVGALIGIVAGTFVVEGIIANALSSQFLFNDYPPYVGVLIAIAITLIELVLVLIATWIACRSILKKHAVELLRGKQPPKAGRKFYERFKFWDKLPLFTQTMINNCVNDKKRMFSTVVGVAGCAALIVTAITLNDDVLASYDGHYRDVYEFNAIVYVDSKVDGAVDKIASTLRDEGASCAVVQLANSMVMQPVGKQDTMRAVVPFDADEFSRLYHVVPTGKGAFDLNGVGVWVSQGFETHAGAYPGCDLELDVGDGVKHHAVVSGFHEFYLTYNEMVMGRDLYKQVFDAEPVANAVLVDTGEKSVDEIAGIVRDMDGFFSIVDDKTAQKGNFNAFSSVSSAVVLIYLALAVLMAIVVLLNLNVMFIDEKKRDLIVLMINGFSIRDAKRYIYNDTIVLTAVGIVVGIVVGCIMGSITVSSVEPGTAYFFKGIAWRAVAIGVAVTTVLAAIMCVISLRRIPRFSLTDINKV